MFFFVKRITNRRVEALCAAGIGGRMMTIRRTTDLTPIVRGALQSFGRARAAIVAGNVDQMIGHLTRGAALIEEIDREAKRARRRASKRSAS
jgi:hypothetical protein